MAHEMQITVPETHTNDIALQFATYFPKSRQPYFYLLWNKLQEGHICVPEDELDEGNIKTLFPDFDAGAIDKADFISDGNVIRPIISLNGNLYLQRYYNYETIIVERIRQLTAQRIGHPDIGALKSRLSKPLVENGEPDWQQVATLACLLNNFTIITGGPGTGKTTTVAGILRVMLEENPHLKVALAAPTGKAAARMTESLISRAQDFPDNLKAIFNRLEPSTIHRLLGSIRNSIHFKHNLQNPLMQDVIIIDESSMIDAALFAKLLDAVRPDAKLILLGDKNQLASVEAGSLFGDLCSVPERLNVFSEVFASVLQEVSDGSLVPEKTLVPSLLSDSIVELQKSYRFSAEKGIGRLSRIVINEQTEELEEFMGEGDAIVKMDTGYNPEFFEQFVSNFGAYIKERDIGQALQKLNLCRVLVAIRSSSFGLYQVNRRIESILEEKKWIRKNIPFYEHRPVIITKNNYKLGLYNGDTGIVRKDEKGELRVWFEIDGRLTDFSPALINNEETAYAITIHKSQGSEFDQVLVLLADFDVPVMTKELIYTAITRAREGVLLQADKEILKAAVSRSVKRGSGLKQRL